MTPPPVRTRFAPSPTGYLHLGGARTALFSWAYARHCNGMFLLRIEDTDLKRSTPEAVQAILDGMHWLGLNPDAPPVYQMHRISRHTQVIGQMLAAGTAYYCYCSPEEINAMRDTQRATGKKPRYDHTWRPAAGKVLPPVPKNRSPVVRFKNPLDGEVHWDDLVKGSITIANSQLDDVIIARPDGTPTYNFCVVVDDWDMHITHVIRGDDHVNNTPRQINILKALGAPIPQYAHVPMILGADGEKLSKRHGAVSIMEYPMRGYLPQAMLNYLARLGWSYGNEEIFSMKQFCAWFDLKNLSPSPAQFNREKLDWFNNHYIKGTDNSYLATLIHPEMEARGTVFSASSPPLAQVCALIKDRVSTLEALADAALIFYRTPAPDLGLYKQYITDVANDISPALTDLRQRCMTIEWKKEVLSVTLKTVLANYQLKMPQLAMPLRLIMTGQSHTPSIDAVLTLLGREAVVMRLEEVLKKIAIKE